MDKSMGFKLLLTKKDWLFLALTTLFLITGLISSFFESHYLLAICATLVNLLFVVKFYKSIPLFILFVFIFLYTKTFNYFFIDNIPISFWSDFQTPSILSSVLINHLIFVFFLGNLISERIGKVNFDIRKLFTPDRFIFWTLLLISVIILVFGMSGQTIFQSGSYAEREGVSKSTLHEYFILLFLFLMLYVPRGRLYSLIVIILFLAYVVKTLLYGGRIEVVQIGLLFFYVRYVFRGLIKIKYVILLILFGIYFNEVISKIRSNPRDLVEGNIAKVFNPLKIFLKNEDVNVISSNEGDVIQSSARIVGLVETSNLTPVQRVISFISYLSSPVVPASLLPKYSNLATYKQDVYQSGGGGLISTYFYVWLGYLGPMLIACFISFVIIKFYEFKNRSIIIYGICVISTFPRWFSYNPIFLVKFCIYAVILSILLILLKGAFRKLPLNNDKPDVLA